MNKYRISTAKEKSTIRKLIVIMVLCLIMTQITTFISTVSHTDYAYAAETDYQLNTIGFINWMLDTKELTKLERQDLEKALEVINKAEEESFTKWYGGDNVHLSDNRNDKVTDPADPDDAVNLRHMVQGISVLKDINKLRKEDENFSNLNYKDAYTNFYFMAVAQTGAMRGAAFKRHTLLQVSCENLCFRSMYPVSRWLEERSAFNRIKNELGIADITTKDQLKQITKYAGDNDITIGHYTNLFWEIDQVMGVGYTPYSKTFCYNAASKSSHENDQYNRGERMYTIDEFEALMKEFCEYVGTHDFDEGTAVREATCTKNGLEKYTCVICGYSENKETPKANHTEETIPGKAATCTETGYTAGKKCAVCDKILTERQLLPALGHDYKVISDSAEAPTCIEDGKEADRECTRCHDIIAGAKITKTGHTEMVIPGRPATCAEAGLTSGKKCSVCGLILEKQQILDLLDHDLTRIMLKKATDKRAGNIEYWMCSDCGKCFSDEDGMTEISKEDTLIKRCKITVKTKKITVKSGKTKTIKSEKIFKVTGNKGKITFKKTGGNGKVKVSSNGKIVIRKGLKKGKVYRIKVKVTSSATAKYTIISKNTVVKIKVR